MSLAPVCLFTYKRLDCTIQTVGHLLKNNLAPQTKLFIFSDAAKREEDQGEVAKVRQYLDSIEGFEEIIVDKKEKNAGLANSIIKGVGQVLEVYGKVIVLEDDLLTSTNFLDYMNAGLDFYGAKPKIFSMAGYTFPIFIPEQHTYDVYFSMRGSSWGWAIWKDRWDKIDWSVKDFNELQSDRSQQRRFNRSGQDLYPMLKKQMEGKIDSWAIRWNYHQFKHQLYSAFPTLSKVQNIGFGGDATHTKSYNRFATPLDQSGKTDFNFPTEPIIDERTLRSFRDKFSLKERIKGKIKYYLGYR